VQSRIGELTEAEIAPLLSQVIGDAPVLDELPSGMRNLLAFTSEPTGQWASAMLMNTGAEIIGGTLAEIAKPTRRPAIYAAEKHFHSLKLAGNQAAVLYSRKKLDEDAFIQRMEWQGYEPVERQFAYDAAKPFTSIPELMMYSR